MLTCIKIINKAKNLLLKITYYNLIHFKILNLKCMNKKMFIKIFFKIQILKINKHLIHIIFIIIITNLIKILIEILLYYKIYKVKKNTNNNFMKMQFIKKVLNL